MQQRDFTRVELSGWATVKHQDNSNWGRIENISLRGLFIQSCQEIPLNSQVEVSVHQTRDSSLDLKATVIRKEDNGVGMIINKMDLQLLVYLRNLITEKSGNQERVALETKLMVGYMLA